MQTNPRQFTGLRWSGVFVVALLTLAAFGCGRAQPPACDHGLDADGGACACEYAGEAYPAGATFLDQDGCNQCTCNEDGNVACTLKLCAQSCGGLRDRGCPAGMYCDYPVEAICGAADGTGTCKAPPEGCNDDYTPVCGCDDKTYGNACSAAVAAMSVAYKSACEGGCVDERGMHHDPGERFPSADGCNTCTCTEGGLISCTERACLP